jgi:hypothetical protein
VIPDGMGGVLLSGGLCDSVSVQKCHSFFREGFGGRGQGEV